MPTIFSDMGQGWLTETLKDSAGQSVTYRRGVYSVEFNATFGRSEFQVTSGDGSFTEVETHDFIFPPADLVLNGSVTVPQAGDTITWTVGGADRLYRVIDQPGFQNHKFDPLRKTLRVYTKRISVT